MAYAIVAVIWAAIFFAGIAIGAEQACPPPAPELVEIPTGTLGWLATKLPFGDQAITILVGLMAVLKTTSWAFGKVSEKIDTKWENDVARYLSRAISYVGWALGLFGVGDMPKSVRHKPPIEKLLKRKKADSSASK